MADAKISELTNITGANLASTDEFAVNDGGSTTVAITAGELLNFINAGLLFTVTTVTATDASYTPSATFEYILLDDTGDDDNIAVTYASEIPDGSVVFIRAADGGSSGHTVTLAGSQTFDGTNNIATFNSVDDAIALVVESSTRVLVFYNNSVTFST